MQGKIEHSPNHTGEVYNREESQEDRAIHPREHQKATYCPIKPAVTGKAGELNSEGKKALGGQKNPSNKVFLPSCRKGIEKALFSTTLDYPLLCGGQPTGPRIPWKRARNNQRVRLI